MLEAILNTLLMNDKSKDTAKARQDLQMLGIRSGLWLGQTKNGKCLKPQAAYSFTPENRKKFCQYIKGVKLPDGFGSCFKHKVTDNDTNITGLKSHDCHIMMQRLLPYGLQNYLPDKIAKPIIDLCSLFKQICSATLMEDDMLKAQIKVVDILCELELIYPPALFDIMVHLVIHLPLEALEGGPIRPRWMFPFERYMKKLKGYVRNKAKPEGSIAEGYVAEEALTFSSYYFRDVTTKFNRPDRNVDPPPPTCQFQVFRSLCKSIGLRSVIRFDAQELKKVIWYVLHNSPEIDTYRSQFKSKFPNKDMKEEFPNWFGSQCNQRVIRFGLWTNTDSNLSQLLRSQRCEVCRAHVHSRDERRTTQNSGICSPGPDGEMYYGQLQEIIEFKYLLFKVALFRVKWFDTSNKERKVKKLVLRNNMTQIDCSREAFKDDQYILVTQVKQVFYLEDKTKPHWKVVEHVNHKKNSDGGVIVVEDDPDIIHFDNSSDLPLSTSLNDLDNATLHINDQSTVVDAPPDIIDVPDEDDDFMMMKTPSYDLMLHGHTEVTVAVTIVPHHTLYPPVAGVALLKRGSGCEYRDKTRNLLLKDVAESKGPVPISFDVGDKHTINPLGPHAAHWSNYIGEVVRSGAFVLPFWRQVAEGVGRRRIISILGPTRESSRWTEIYESIKLYLQKPTIPTRLLSRPRHWKAKPHTGVSDVELIGGHMAGFQTLRVSFSTSLTPLAITPIDGELKAEVMVSKQRMRSIALASGGMTSWDTFPSVGRVLPSRATSRPSMPAPDKSLKSMHRKVDFMMSLFRSDSKYSDMFKEFESGGASGSGGCGDDEECGDDEDGDGDD
ncbi:hypothetical protein Tco_0614478 [Tanacetum coccineum]